MKNKIIVILMLIGFLFMSCNYYDAEGVNSHGIVVKGIEKNCNHYIITLSIDSWVQDYDELKLRYAEYPDFKVGDILELTTKEN